MKSILLLRFPVMALAIILLAGCTKDEQVSAVPAAQLQASSGSIRPDPAFTGSVSGTLSPIPATATIHVYTGREVFASGSADVNGHFKIGNLPDGMYNLLIRYTLFTDQSDEGHTKVLSDIKVLGQGNTELGTINLE